MRGEFGIAAGLLTAFAGAAAAQAPQPSPTPTPPTYAEIIQVTATRVPEDVDDVPTSIQVISAKELRDRGATDLPSALALASGTYVAPGGDGGPASAVPQFWGLQEIDAFLLVVDGVPWGGAFNPAVSTLDLNDVERIEVQNGPAPVMYGATSFVGVIQVVRKPPGTKGTSLAASGGRYTSGSGALSTQIPTWLGFSSSLVADFQRQGFPDERTSFKKTHVLWRNQRAMGAGAFHFDFDAVLLRQQPASPSPRTGPVLSPRVPIDSNQNPEGAFLDQDRYFLNLGYDRTLSIGSWSTTLAWTPSSPEAFRGFLTDVSESDPNSHGFRQTTDVDDLYFDTHVAWNGSAHWKAVAGFDYLYGNGKGQGGDFDYFVDLDGSNPPTSAELPSQADVSIQDRRNFGGLYGQMEWLPSSAWRVEGGVRLNVTGESRQTSAVEFESGEVTGGQDDATTVRPSGSLGVTWTAWQRGSATLRVFGNWASTFKPSAVDFGLDSEAGILKPETSNSFQAGLKSELLGRALRLGVAGYWLEFNNLVVAQTIGGLPALSNAGHSRLKGVDFSASWQIVPRLIARGTYAWQAARFQNYLTEFDGVPTQLGGKRIEMSPHNLGAFSLSWSPERGAFASTEMSFVGSRYLNRRNTALAGGYASLTALVGWRTERWELRLMGRNLTDRRNPVSESELGDAQYYRLFARRFDVVASVRF